MIAISKPYIGKEEKQAVANVLDSGFLAQGKQVAQFEAEFANYCGVKYAIATTSGTTALWVALLAHGIGPGDEVITSPFTFIASANSIRYAGATPVFTDIDPKTFNIDPQQIEAKITPRTKAIMPIHLYGLLCDMPAIMDIAKRHDLAIIEDACQAHGATINGRKSGSFGTGCFSFYATKNMMTGEGGIITTDDDHVADQSRLIRAHGMRQRYYHEMVGYNFRMTDIQGAIGRVQLERLENITQQRITNANYLKKGLSGLERVVLPAEIANYRHVFHQFTIRVLADRETFCQYLSNAGVGCAIYYPVPVHKQEIFQDGYQDGYYPVVESACQQVVSLPVHPNLSHQELDQIIATVIDAVNDQR